MKLYVTLCVYIIFFESFVDICSCWSSPPPLTLLIKSLHTVEIDNGIVNLTLTNPTGHIAGVAYKGEKNVLEYRFKDSQRGYWDIMWSSPKKRTSSADKLSATNFRVIANTIDRIEVSFTKIWDFSLGQKVVPLNIDKRYIVLRGVSGFYSYAIFHHLKGWPRLNIEEARITLKLHQDKFHYMAISDDMQRIMPTDIERERGHVLHYKEAVLLTNPINPRLRGEVDDKYQYACDNEDSRVHGWISTDPRVGLWVITPSTEFRPGGPVKTDLTSHASATSLAIFFSGHYAGPSFALRIRQDEDWKKVFGPIFVYLNSGNLTTTLWNDAKKQMLIETKKWPYDFPESNDFPRANSRGIVRGRLLVHDSYINSGGQLIPARSAHIGLAPPGNEGSWQDDAKGYQFWTRTNGKGYFIIRGIRGDTYSLYAWVPGFIGDFKHENHLIIQPGSDIQLGNLVYNPPRNGPTVWEIGIPDRTAAEFYIPDPAPELMTKLFIRHREKFRQYGLWDRYTDLYAMEDLVYTVGSSNYTRDWFFAHVNRKTGKNKYVPTTWKIRFDLKNVIRRGHYTLRIALASATMAEIQVNINNPNRKRAGFTTGQIGRDNAIARHGIHGRYWLYSVDVRGVELVNGRNTIYLKQARGSNPFIGVMYDYLRLEAPSNY